VAWEFGRGPLAGAPALKNPITGTAACCALTASGGLQYYEMVLASVRGAPPTPTEAGRIAASARHIAEGEARERESEQLRAEQAARSEAFQAEQRRLAAGELPR
jgi:hypothetical protein